MSEPTPFDDDPENSVEDTPPPERDEDSPEFDDSEPTEG